MKIRRSIVTWSFSERIIFLYWIFSFSLFLPCFYTKWSFLKIIHGQLCPAIWARICFLKPSFYAFFAKHMIAFCLYRVDSKSVWPRFNRKIKKNVSLLGGTVKHTKIGSLDVLPKTFTKFTSTAVKFFVLNLCAWVCSDFPSNALSYFINYSFFLLLTFLT